VKRVHVSEALAEVVHFRNLLEQEGILCLVKNEQLSGGVGDIPFLECLPELWVARDEDYAEALELIAETKAEKAPAREWLCRSCGETNEGQFAACWRCGRIDD
jgi:Putative prokaryotic signal transducing protein